jgi:major intracellular serine protease
MAPTLATPSEVKTPKYSRSSAEGISIDPDNLPTGIKLTGGVELRKANLTGKGIKVAVIDSGVDAEHPSFNGMVKQQVWFRYGTPLEEGDHGTHVAGTIHMMAPDAEIYDYRVFGEEGFDIEDATSKAVFEAVFDGCDVINMSLGGRWPDSRIQGAVHYAQKKGVIVVCAAGNEGDGNEMTNERSYPALWDETISIAAVGKDGDLPVAYFSNSNPEVDYAGIGVDVLSFKPGGDLHKMSGTSMACPHVAGFIAALLSGGNVFSDKIEDKEKKLSELREFLKKYTVDIGDKGKDNNTGLGFLTYLSSDQFHKEFASF